MTAGGIALPQIVLRTRDPFAVTLLCEWADHHDVETLAVSRPDDRDWVRVILYGLEATDPLFHEFGKITLASYEDGECPWVPSSIDPAELSEIVTAVASEDWWQAYFVRLQDVSLGGPTAARATAVLCRDFGIDLSRLVPGNSGRNDRLLMHVQPARVRACPDCMGAGACFHTEPAELCSSCGGAGVV